jgi:hypothetical protein
VHIKQVNSNALTMQNIGWAKCIAPLPMLVTYGTSTNFCIVYYCIVMHLQFHFEESALYCIVMHLQFHFEESAFDQLDGDCLPKLKRMQSLKSVIHKFVRLRIHEFATKFSREKTTKRQFGSKTACRSTVIF